jgi:hypothetical protein
MAYISFQPSDHFNTKLYTGTDSSNAITGVGFQPDWVWIKKRSGVASHALMDAVRGNDKSLRSNTTGAEYTNSYFTSFDSDGFTVATSESDVNASSATYASWNWKANGSGSANTDGSISSTVSANTTSGFSIVTYTGTGISSGTATVGHGLGEVPSVVILKRTGGTANWNMYHKSIGNTGSLALNLASATNTQTDFWGDTTPTSSVVTIGPNTDLSGGNVMYCFAEKKGFSKFGSYTGNGNADGAFVYTGFRPAFIMFKDTSTAYDWMIFDNKRNGYNPDNDDLEPSNTSAESNTDKLDILSNGFKLRKADADANASGDTFIYMAFAEHPLVSSNDIPATAR